MSFLSIGSIILIVIPVGLVGGLEFDVVVVVDHEKYDLQDIYETQQLYLAVTRATHKLILA
jgi:DNA helicase IV